MLAEKNLGSVQKINQVWHLFVKAFQPQTKMDICVQWPVANMTF